ncbi:hypothetical protein E1193_02565 [Micromonospora sp. KC606]|uniref:hypothetical protein n=1 Tax=Micromonospora sp. KC606 TaxID=2530379 RepID=UPI001053110A|nr:hypothetical protein [Micromonospora sp. KC606]TDC85535.1 hypothetical protein E1193_02565 [Micromonospora sp. KC606]
MATAELPARYSSISVDEMQARYRVAADMLYPCDREQQVRLYEESLQLVGDLNLVDWTGDGYPYNVIVDGDLTVEGDVTYFCDEGPGFLHLVTGTLRARNLFLNGFPNVVVRGDLIVTHGVLGCYGEDGGLLKVAGKVQAQTVVKSWHFNTSFASRPQSVVVADRSVADGPSDHTEDLAASALLPDLLNNDGDIDTDRVEQALRRGQPILRSATP